MRYAVSAALVTAAIAGSAVAQPFSMQFLSRGSSGIYAGSAAEIPTFDPLTNRVFVVNGATGSVDVFGLSSAGVLSPAGTISVPGISLPGKINSVAVRNGVLAVAANDNSSNQLPGSVHFFNTGSFAPLGSTPVGAIPDMITFTPDGTRLLAANEGEPNSYGQVGSVDPEGSVSIVNLSFPMTGQVNIGATQTATFTPFNGQAAALRAQGVRIYGPGATVAQDLEPEYIAVSPDSTKAYVTLQEANAMATVDIATGTVESIRSFGLKNHSLSGNGIDPSDRDGPSINIRNVPVMGMYQPDAIASFTVNGQTFLITANEGDARDYTGFAEEIRVGNSAYVLDPTTFPNAASLKQNANLGRLTVSTATGDTDADGDFDQIHVLGARSFSIWTPELNQAFDSGDQLEQITALAHPLNFNASNDNNDLDNRSDNKGPEPEGVVIGDVFGRTMAFIGLERIGGIMMFDVTDPGAVQFVDYINTRDFLIVPGQSTLGQVGDLGPEGLFFIPADQSPTGLPLLIVGFEVSGTTGVFQIIPTPGALAALALGGAAAARRRRPAV